MHVRLLKDKTGKALASINSTPEDAILVPLDVEAEDGGTFEELEVQPRDLLDLDEFYEKIRKKEIC